MTSLNKLTMISLEPTKKTQSTVRNNTIRGLKYRPGLFKLTLTSTYSLSLFSFAKSRQHLQFNKTKVLWGEGVERGGRGWGEKVLSTRSRIPICLRQPSKYHSLSIFRFQFTWTGIVNDVVHCQIKIVRQSLLISCLIYPRCITVCFTSGFRYFVLYELSWNTWALMAYIKREGK